MCITEEENSTLSVKLYITCPVCAKQLFQVESVKGCKIKCNGCHKYILVNAENGKVVTEIIKIKKYSV